MQVRFRSTVSKTARTHRVYSGICLAAVQALLVLVFVSEATGDDRKSYPESGRVASMHLEERTIFGHGSSVTIRKPVYRIEAETKYYDMEAVKKEHLEIGETIHFRIDKDWAFVQRESHEEKFRLVRVDLKSDH